MKRTTVGTWLWVSLLALLGCGLQAQAFEHKPEAPLENTQWKLIWLSGAKIDAATPLQMPYILLTPDTHRVSGSGGCNHLVGPYELKGEALRFPQIAMTRMACLHGGDTEAAFTTALDEVRSWKIDGRKLLLMDADQHVVAKFAALAPAS